jgi:hypothetical protein
MRPAAEVYDAVCAAAHDTLDRAAQEHPDLGCWDLMLHLHEVTDAARELDGLASGEEDPWCGLVEEAWRSERAYLVKGRRLRDACGADP